MSHRHRPVRISHLAGLAAGLALVAAACGGASSCEDYADGLGDVSAAVVQMSTDARAALAQVVTGVEAGSLAADLEILADDAAEARRRLGRLGNPPAEFAESADRLGQALDGYESGFETMALGFASNDEGLRLEGAAELDAASQLYTEAANLAPLVCLSG